jgi:hypothetical protein
VHAVVLAVVEQAMAPMHQRLEDLEERSLYLIRLIAAGAASPPAPPETRSLASAPPAIPTVRGRGSRRAIALVACILALGVGSLFGLAHLYH